MATPGPQAYLILQDPQWAGADSLVSVTSQGGRSAGAIEPATANEGTVVGIQEGTPSTDTETEFYLLGGGVAASGGWLHRLSGESSTAWRAINALTVLWRQYGWQTSNKMYAVDICYSTAFSKIIATWIDNTGAIRIESQDAQSPFGAWTSTTISTSGESADTSTEGGVGICELPDGGLLVCYQQQDSTNGFLNVNAYLSTDGGTTWTLVQRRLLTKTSLGVLGSSGGQYQLRSSGDWVRLTFNSTAVGGVGIGTAVQKTLVSSDRGASWAYAGSLTAYPWKSLVGYAGSAPTALVGLGDVSGTFILAYLDGLASTTLSFAIAQRADNWENVVSLDLDCSSYATSPKIKGVVAVKDPDRVWFFVWVEGSDKSEIIARVLMDPTDPTNTANWTTMGPISGYGGVLRYGPHCWRGAWAGDRLVMVGGLQDPDVAATADPVVAGTNLIQSGNWDPKPWDYSQKDVSYHNYLISGHKLIHYGWQPHTGSPAGDATNSDANTPWTRVTAGAITATWEPHRQYLSTSSGAGRVLYRLGLGTPGASDRWGSTAAPRGFCFHFSSLVSATRVAPATGEDCGIKIAAMDGSAANGYVFTLRIGPNGVTFYDDIAGSAKVSVTTTAFQGRTEVRIWGKADSWGFSFRAITTSTRDPWTDNGPYTFTSGAVAAQRVDMGILAASGGGGSSTMEIHDFAVSYQTDASQRSDISKPTQLMGSKLNRGAVAVYGGVRVRWGGSGGYNADQFTGKLDYARGKQNLSIDSPQSYWESKDLTSQNLVFGAGDGAQRWQLDAILLIGTVDRGCTIEFNNTDSWGAPSASASVNADLYTGLSVTSLDGNAMELTKATGSWPPRRGSLIGAYLRFTSGTLQGWTFRIVGDTRKLWIIVNTDTSLAALGAAVNDSCVIFGDRMLWTGAIKQYSFFRIVFPDVSSVASSKGTATGTHRLGALIPGFSQQFTVPLEWSFRDNEQPNVTELRTRSGASWQYQEGRAQRIIDAKIVGDVDEFRRSLRDMLREIHGYSVKPVGILLDDQMDPDRAVLLYGRWTAGSQQDEAAWYQDSDGNWRTAGDTDFVFTEEP